MRVIDRLVDQLRRTFSGEAWHGPSLTAVLAGISAEEAAARPILGSHTIWEIVRHIEAWQTVGRRRLEGESVDRVPDEIDWPPMEDTSEEAWRRDRRSLERSREALLAAVEAFDSERIDDAVPDTDYSFYTLVHGVIQHDLYHGGQIVLLAKAVRAQCGDEA